MKIKNLLLLTLAIAVSFTSCSKNENVKPKEEAVSILGEWELYAAEREVTEDGKDPVVTKEELNKDFLSIFTFKADGTAILKSYDEEKEIWEEELHTYEAKDGVFKLVEDGADENESGYYTKGTYELTKDQLILKQTITEEYQGKKSVYKYTNKLRRPKK